MQNYKEEFFKNDQLRSHSAQVIVPLILEFIQPSSVIDIGCATGEWLAVFNQYGIKNILGVDGSYVNKMLLKIPEDNFVVFDLEKPLTLSQEYDLVISLEVAEHLPQKCAQEFINSLTNLGPIILFSAAIPFQGGTNHLNEQWQDYWMEYFNREGFLPVDCLRKRIWQYKDIAIHYKQNMLFYVKKSSLHNYKKISEAAKYTEPSQISIVHPELYFNRADPHAWPLEKMLPVLPKSLWDFIKRKIKIICRRFRVFDKFIPPD